MASTSENSAVAALEKKFESEISLWKATFSYVDSMVLKAAVELNIFTTLASGPKTLNQIVSETESTNIGDDAAEHNNRVDRIVAFLVRKDLIKIVGRGNDKQYELAPSKTAVSNDSILIKGMIGFVNSLPVLGEFHILSQHVKNGKIPHIVDEKDPPRQLWKFDLPRDKSFKETIYNAKESLSENVSKALLSQKREIFNNIREMVYIGKRSKLLSEIVVAFPDMNKVTFFGSELSNPPRHERIQFKKGELFEDDNDIPEADAILTDMLHEFDNSACSRILQKCNDMLKKRNGRRLILLEIELPEPSTKNDTADVKFAFDFLWFLLCGGKERTKAEWRKLLEAAGFDEPNFEEIAALPSVIETSPKPSAEGMV